MENNNEQFFKDAIMNLTSMKNSFLQLPNMICFNFCLKEMLDLCNVNSETGNKKYFELAKDFFYFLKKDTILKQIDMGKYITLMKRLKEFIDNRDKINTEELYNFFKHTKLIFGNLYVEKLKEEVLNNLICCNDYKRFSILIETFINEMLSRGYTYKFLNEIVKEYCYNTHGIFSTPKDMINFLLYKKENYDIYIPLKNFKERDYRFIKNGFKEQDIKIGKELKIEDKEFLPDTYYCHIYFNSNDYYKGINKLLKRLKSIFNFEKFYIGSYIDFDYTKKCIIKANKILKIEDKTLHSILYYAYYRGTYKIIDSSITTFKKLTGFYEKEDKEDSILAKDLFNIIDYSEKDDNIISIEQFINKWIALETLYSKASNKSGFDAVITYAPKILAIDYLRKKISIILKRTNIKNRYKKIEEFIYLCYSENADNEIKRIKSEYYRMILNEYKDIVTNLTKLNREIDNISEKIKMNIYRIYISRNRYVHTGETKSYYDIPQYMLLQILATSMDKFMRGINDLDNKDVNEITWDVVFTNIINKYTTIFEALKVLCEDLKIDKTLTITKDDVLNEKDTIENIIVKILLEKHIGLFEKKKIPRARWNFYNLNKCTINKMTMYTVKTKKNDNISKKILTSIKMEGRKASIKISPTYIEGQTFKS